MEKLSREDIFRIKWRYIISGGSGKLNENNKKIK